MREYVFRGHVGRFWGLIRCFLHGSIAFVFEPELIVHHAETTKGHSQGLFMCRIHVFLSDLSKKLHCRPPVRHARISCVLSR